MASTAQRGELDPLICDLIQWIGDDAKPYSDVMEAWRTSCPRLTVWEDAVERGFVARQFEPERGLMVKVTTAGRQFASSRNTSHSA